MAPRTEFALSSAGLALLLAIAAFVLVAHQGNVAQWAAGARESLKWAPASALAALFGAILAGAWHRRAMQRQKRWTAGGLTLRTLLLSFLLFPLVLALWMLGFTFADQLWAASPGTVDDGLAWLPLTVLLFTVFGIVLGAVPAFVIEYFVCRRYLRRLAVVTTGSA